MPSNRTTHGLSGSRLYNVWRGMKERCHYPKHRHYGSYGGRGISVCEEWRGNFAAFAKWAALSGYEDGLSIDRKENDDDYEPSNCRWITRSENTAIANRKRNYTYMRNNKYAQKKLSTGALNL